MRITTRWVALLGIALLGIAAPGTTFPETNPAWEKLKTLVGEWKGTYAGADAAGAGEVRISYALVSNGTSLMETMESGHDSSMITMYHVDGSRILATHYCAMGNQPRLAASVLGKNGRTLTFSFVDATNASGPDAELMKGLVVTFQDPDHFTQQWTSRMGGKDQVGTFTYSRVR
jgi:hypothetical protein